MFDGFPSLSLIAADETNTSVNDDLPVARKRKAKAVGKSRVRENISPNQAADPPSKCKKTKSKEEIDSNLGAAGGTRPSRANAGGKYKEVRDQVKVGRKRKVVSA